MRASSEGQCRFYADLLLQSDDLTSDTEKGGIFPLSGTVFSVSSGRLPFYGLVYLTLKSDKEFACLRELKAYLAVLERFPFTFCFFQNHLTEYDHSHTFVQCLTNWLVYQFQLCNLPAIFKIHLIAEYLK